MKAVPIEEKKARAPVIQVMARRPRHAAIQNLPHRCTTIDSMNSCTDQKCTLLTKCPVDDVWYQAGPSKLSTRPLTTSMMKPAIVATPKT